MGFIGLGIVTDIPNTINGDNTGSGKDPGDDHPSGVHKRKGSVAVALQYESDSEFAPKVVAGGRGAVAEQILNVAFAAGVKVRSDADLAEMLSTIDVDSEIPIEAFAAVAEILAYVYRLNGTLPEFANANELAPTTETPDAPG